MTMIVTVVVPTFCRPRQLQACLRALAAQTFQEPWEVVVVDDGGAPSIELGDAVPEFLPGWRLIRQANAGPAAARNHGVREARGEFIAFTDDDCLPERTWLERLVQAAREHPSSLVGGTTFNGLTKELFASTSQLIVDLVYEHFNRDPNHAYFLASNNILCPREQYLDLGGFDESFRRAGAEDRDFCDRWRMRKWPIVWRPEARVEHRHTQSFRQFVALYVRYGRGAYRYQSIRRRRGSGTMNEELGLHATVPRRVFRHLARRGGVLSSAATIAALGVWQAANALGFMSEALAALRNRAAGRGDAERRDAGCRDRAT